MWGETSAVGDRDSGPSNRALQSALKISMTGKPQATAAGVTQTDALNNRSNIAVRGTPTGQCAYL